jgi:hypothetical protein
VVKKVDYNLLFDTGRGKLELVFRKNFQDPDNPHRPGEDIAIYNGPEEEEVGLNFNRGIQGRSAYEPPTLLIP